jgi:hypothetical protein
MFYERKASVESKRMAIIVTGGAGLLGSNFVCSEVDRCCRLERLAAPLAKMATAILIGFVKIKSCHIQ